MKTYICIGPYCWGRSHTIKGAIANAKKNKPATFKPTRFACQVFEVHPEHRPKLVREMNMTLKIVSKEALCDAYMALYPNEIKEDHRDDGIRIMGNWLDGYDQDPERKIGVGKTWAGKVTTALFLALGIKQPRLKREMLGILLHR